MWQWICSKRNTGKKLKILLEFFWKTRNSFDVCLRVVNVVNPINSGHSKKNCWFYVQAKKLLVSHILGLIYRPYSLDSLPLSFKVWHKVKQVLLWAVHSLTVLRWKGKYTDFVLFSLDNMATPRRYMVLVEMRYWGSLFSSRKKYLRAQTICVMITFWNFTLNMSSLLFLTAPTIKTPFRWYFAASIRFVFPSTFLSNWNFSSN